MTKRNVLSTFIALMAMMTITIVAGTNTARAQQNLNCCIYTVDVAGVSPSCFPIRLWTRWSNGVFGPTIVNANGNFVFATPTPPPCPPAATFIGASLAGPGGPYATFNNPVTFNVNGCCLIVRIGFDANGCLIIYIRQTSTC